MILETYYVIESYNLNNIKLIIINSCDVCISVY